MLANLYVLSFFFMCVAAPMKGAINFILTEKNCFEIELTTSDKFQNSPSDLICSMG